MDSKDAYFLSALANLDIYPDHIISEIPVEDFPGSDFFANPVGTGPYEWVDFEPGSFAILEAYDQYHRGSPKIERVIYQNLELETAAFAGDVDFAGKHSIEAKKEIDDLENYRVITHHPPRNQYFRTLHSDYMTEKVRKALLHAINRKEISKELYDGDAAVATNPIIPQNYYYTNEELSPYEYDPEKAETMLEEADWDPDRTLNLIYYYDDPLTERVMTMIQHYFSQVGVDSEIRFLEIPDLITALNKRNFDLVYSGVNVVDPNSLDVYRSYQSGDYTNPPEEEPWGNAAVDALLEAGAKTLEPEARKEIYDVVQEIMHEELPSLNLWSPPTYSVKSERLDVPEGVINRMIGAHDFKPHLWEVQES